MGFIGIREALKGYRTNKKVKFVSVDYMYGNTLGSYSNTVTVGEIRQNPMYQNYKVDTDSIYEINGHIEILE